MKFPISVTGIDWSGESDRSLDYAKKDCGRWVRVRPCSDDTAGKTFLGIYLGDMMTSPMVSLTYDGDPDKAPKSGKPLRKGKLKVIPMRNPAIYVPDLKRVVWGFGSFWGFIDSPDDMRDVTDATIDNQWYVRALHDLANRG